MPSIGSWTCHNTTKRFVKRITDRNNETHKCGCAACGQKGQQEPHSEQGVDYVKDVINHLGNSRESSGPLYFALSFNDLVNCLRTKIARYLIDSLGFAGCGFGCGAFANFRLHLAFNLALYRFMLSGAAR